LKSKVCEEHSGVSGVGVEFGLVHDVKDCTIIAVILSANVINCLIHKLIMKLEEENEYEELKNGPVPDSSRFCTDFYCCFALFVLFNLIFGFGIDSLVRGRTILLTAGQDSDRYLYINNYKINFAGTTTRF
jgi:hypothetical protein